MVCLAISETCFFTIAGVPSTFEQLQNVIKSNEACSCAITALPCRQSCCIEVMGHGAFKYHLHFALAAWIDFKASQKFEFGPLRRSNAGKVLYWGSGGFQYRFVFALVAWICLAASQKPEFGPLQRPHAGKVDVLRFWRLPVSSPLCSCGMNLFRSISEVWVWTITALPCRQSCCFEVEEASSTILTSLLWHELVSKYLRSLSLDHYSSPMQAKLLYRGCGGFQ